MQASDWAAERLGFRWRDPALLDVALRHRSAGGIHNERLEFLGDALLSFVVAQLLFREFATATEGDLSRYRASLVNGEALADLAEELGIGAQLLLGGGELKSGGFRRRSILADAFEALLGAIYLDGGFEPARAVIERLVRPKLAALPAAPALRDPKTRLQEWLQGRNLPLPRYGVEAVSGAPHEQHFRVACEIAELGVLTYGEGSSRRRAEQAAAERALARVGRAGAAS